jgi:hypothetical protein
VTSVLNLALARYAAPECIRVDNGPEFISKAVALWAYAHAFLLFLPAGKALGQPLQRIVQQLASSGVLE